MATPSQKDVIYIDVDDEITAVIEKVQESTGKIVALVLPKRATVFQSIVNMKLLKRSAATAKKNLVLITSEANLMPLAGAVGMHVAKTLQSKPEVPVAPSSSDAPVSVDEEIEDLSDGPAAAAGIPTPPPSDDDETIEIDNDDTSGALGVAAGAAAGKAAKPKLDKKLKIPDFNKFRTKMILGGAIFLVLITGWIFGTFILPKATITIKTDSTDVASAITVTASPTVKSIDTDKKIVPGLLKEVKKTDAQKAPATGQKDMGTKASGSATLSLADCSKEQVTVPSGTIITSGNFNFITQADVTMQSVKIGATCRNSDFKNISTAKVSVTAQNAGDSYNLSARSYTVAGFGNVAGAGEAMSGGTSKIVKVVSQQDIDSLRQKILDSINATANQEITAQLKSEGYFPITDTFISKDPLVVSSPGADSEAAEVTVNVTVTYTMAGAKQSDLVQLLENDIKGKIDTSKQNILNNGLDTATIKIEDKKPTGVTRFVLQVTATAGVEQNVADIKKSVAGKKKNEVAQILQTHPGVKEVDVKYSPFWVYKVPSSQGKITVNFEQQNKSTSNE